MRIQALGCTLPEPLLSPARTKSDGIAFLAVRPLLPADAEANPLRRPNKIVSPLLPASSSLAEELSGSNTLPT